MRPRSRRVAVLLIAFLSLSVLGFRCPGLNFWAFLDLHIAGVDRYVGQFEPATAEAMGDWTKYTYDTEGGEGPGCIDGSPFTTFVQERDPRKLIVYLNGGGACWKDFYFCTIQADQTPPGASGIFADAFDDGSQTIENPFADWSKVYVSYCDGSVFTGDNSVEDPNFPAGPVRHHRGLRNVTAALDLARDHFPRARRVLLAGSSAGGYGVSASATGVFRFVFGNWPRLFVFNDAGPALANLALPGAIEQREEDWSYLQFVPSSCTECTLYSQPAELIKWGLRNDSGLRGALYSTDADGVIRFFLGLGSQEEYRDLLLGVHGPIVEAYPGRYKRFIRSGDSSHTSLRGDLFYTAELEGVPLYQWAADFVRRGRRSWVDLVEDLVPTP